MNKGLLLVCLVVFLAGIDANSILLFKQFANNLPKNTVRILMQHGCVPRKLIKRQEESVERWTYVSLHCNHLQTNVIQSVICDKTCMDPVTCKKLTDLKGVPVIQGQQITTSGNVSKMIDIPVACKCVPRMSKMKCMNLSRPMAG